MRKLAAGLAVLLWVVSMLGACGNDELSADEVVERTFDAIDQPGMVYHVEADNGSEVWMDTENELFRRKEATNDGGLTSVGRGWMKTTYDPFNNIVQTQDESPSEQLPPRINHPAVQWLEPLTALAYGRELELIGETSSVDGRRVIAVLARSPVVSGDQATGETLVGRVEVDARTYEIVAFERRREPPPGATPDPQETVTRILYRQPEHLERNSLPADFFDISVVESQVVTLEENIAKMHELGFTPYWVGAAYEAHDVAIAVKREQGGSIVDTEAGEGSFHYTLGILSGEGVQEFDESVVIKLAPAGTVFGPPPVPGFAGNTPEQSREVTAHGAPAVLYRSVLTPSDLPCPAEPCARSDVPVFYRLALTLGDTAIQIETSARVDLATGTDLNVYNSESGILELAEALVVAESPAR